MLNVLLGAAAFIATLAKLGIFVVGQKIMSDTIGDLVMRGGSPVVMFIRGAVNTLRNIFMGLFGWGTWNAEDTVYQAAA